MKKHLQKIIAGVLIGASMVSLTACSSSEVGNNSNGSQQDQKIPMGRYIEETIELPEAMQFVIQQVRTSEGLIDIYGYDKENKVIAYHMNEDGSWVEKDVKWANDLIAQGKRLDIIAYDSKDEAYVFALDPEYNPYIAKVTAEGTLEEVAIAWPEHYSYVSAMKVSEDGDIFVGQQNVGVLRFDGETGSLVTQYDGIVGEFAITGDSLMQIDMQRGGIVIFDLETGVEREMIVQDSLDWSSNLLADQEGNAYMVSKNGISRLAKGGSVWENIIEGEMSAFGMPSMNTRAVTMKNSEEFFALFMNQAEGNELIRYTYDETVPARPTTEVSIYMLEENITVRQAAAEYQRQNPEVFINLQIGMKDGAGMTKTDAIRTLNTELLAGKGPDLLILDGLPVQSYIDKGVLMDMSDFADVQIEEGKWLNNIVGAYQEDGEIYALPTRFTLPMMWGNPDIVEHVNTLEELAQWAEAHPEKQVLYPMTPQQLIEQFYGGSASAWLDESGQIKQEEFIVFIESIKKLSSPEAEMTANTNYTAIEDKSIEYLAYNDTELHLQSSNGFYNMMYPYSAMLQRDAGSFGLAVSEEIGVFEPHGIIGINAKSDNLEVAQGIVEVAMSEKVQDVELGGGYPVNKNSFDKQATADSGTTMAIKMTAPGSRPIELATTDEGTIKKVAEYAQTVEVPVVTDDILMQMIIEETKGYFDGDKSAEEAAAATAQRTKAYLAE